MRNPAYRPAEGLIWLLCFLHVAMAVIAPPQPWRRKSVVYKTIISFNTVTEYVTLGADSLAQETCAAEGAPPVNDDIKPPITYSACSDCPIATISDSNQRITSIGTARDNGTHTYVPYYFAGFHEWVFARTKTVTLYMSLSAINGQPAAAPTGASEVRTSYTYSISILPSIVSVSHFSSVYESTSRISSTGPVIINSGSSDESTVYVFTAPTVLTFSKTTVSDSTVYTSQTFTLPAIITNIARLSPDSFDATDSRYSSEVFNSSPFETIVTLSFPPTYWPYVFTSASIPATSTTTTSSTSPTSSSQFFDIYADESQEINRQITYPIIKGNNTAQLQLNPDRNQYVKTLSVYLTPNGELIDKATGDYVYLFPTTDFQSLKARFRRRRKRQESDTEAWSIQTSEDPPDGALKEGFNITDTGVLGFSTDEFELLFAYCSSSEGDNVREDIIYGLKQGSNLSNCVQISLLAMDSDQQSRSSESLVSSTPAVNTDGATTSAATSRAPARSLQNARQGGAAQANTRNLQNTNTVISPTDESSPGSASAASDEGTTPITMEGTGSIQTIIVTMDESEFNNIYTPTSTGSAAQNATPDAEAQSAEAPADAALAQSNEGGATPSAASNNEPPNGNAFDASNRDTVAETPISATPGQSPATTTPQPGGSSFQTTPEANVGIVDSNAGETPQNTPIEQTGATQAASSINNGQTDDAQSPSAPAEGVSAGGTQQISGGTSGSEGPVSAGTSNTAVRTAQLGGSRPQNIPSQSEQPSRTLATQTGQQITTTTSFASMVADIPVSSPDLLTETFTTTGSDGSEMITTVTFTSSFTDRYITESFTTTAADGEVTTIFTTYELDDKPQPVTTVVTTTGQDGAQTVTTIITSASSPQDGSFPESTFTFVDTTDGPGSSRTDTLPLITRTVVVSTDENGREYSTTAVYQTSLDPIVGIPQTPSPDLVTSTVITRDSNHFEGTTTIVITQTSSFTSQVAENESVVGGTTTPLEGVSSITSQNDLKNPSQMTSRGPTETADTLDPGSSAGAGAISFPVQSSSEFSESQTSGYSGSVVTMTFGDVGIPITLPPDTQEVGSSVPSGTETSPVTSGPIQSSQSPDDTERVDSSTSLQATLVSSEVEGEASSSIKSNESGYLTAISSQINLGEPPKSSRSDEFSTTAAAAETERNEEPSSADISYSSAVSEKMVGGDATSIGLTTEPATGEITPTEIPGEEASERDNTFSTAETGRQTDSSTESENLTTMTPTMTAPGDYTGSDRDPSTTVTSDVDEQHMTTERAGSPVVGYPELPSSEAVVFTTTVTGADGIESTVEVTQTFYSSSPSQGLQTPSEDSEFSSTQVTHGETSDNEEYTSPPTPIVGLPDNSGVSTSGSLTSDFQDSEKSSMHATSSSGVIIDDFTGTQGFISSVISDLQEQSTLEATTGIGSPIVGLPQPTKTNEDTAAMPSEPSNEAGAGTSATEVFISSGLAIESSSSYYAGTDVDGNGSTMVISQTPIVGLPSQAPQSEESESSITFSTNQGDGQLTSETTTPAQESAAEASSTPDVIITITTDENGFSSPVEITQTPDRTSITPTENGAALTSSNETENLTETDSRGTSERTSESRSDETILTSTSVAENGETTLLEITYPAYLGGSSTALITTASTADDGKTQASPVEVSSSEGMAQSISSNEELAFSPSRTYEASSAGSQTAVEPGTGASAGSDVDSSLTGQNSYPVFDNSDSYYTSETITFGQDTERQAITASSTQKGGDWSSSIDTNTITGLPIRTDLGPEATTTSDISTAKEATTVFTTSSNVASGLTDGDFDSVTSSELSDVSNTTGPENRPDAEIYTTMTTDENGSSSLVVVTKLIETSTSFISDSISSDKDGVDSTSSDNITLSRSTDISSASATDAPEDTSTTPSDDIQSTPTEQSYSNIIDPTTSVEAVYTSYTTHHEGNVTPVPMTSSVLVETDVTDSSNITVLSTESDDVSMFTSSTQTLSLELGSSTALQGNIEQSDDDTSARALSMSTTIDYSISEDGKMVSMTTTSPLKSEFEDGATSDDFLATTDKISAPKSELASMRTTEFSSDFDIYTSAFTSLETASYATYDKTGTQGGRESTSHFGFSTLETDAPTGTTSGKSIETASLADGVAGTRISEDVENTTSQFTTTAKTMEPVVNFPEITSSSSNHESSAHTKWTSEVQSNDFSTTRSSDSDYGTSVERDASIVTGDSTSDLSFSTTFASSYFDHSSSIGDSAGETTYHSDADLGSRTEDESSLTWSQVSPTEIESFSLSSVTKDTNSFTSSVEPTSASGDNEHTVGGTTALITESETSQSAGSPASPIIGFSSITSSSLETDTSSYADIGSENSQAPITSAESDIGSSLEPSQTSSIATEDRQNEPSAGGATKILSNPTETSEAANGTSLTTATENGAQTSASLDFTDIESSDVFTPSRNDDYTQTPEITSTQITSAITTTDENGQETTVYVSQTATSGLNVETTSGDGSTLTTIGPTDTAASLSQIIGYPDISTSDDSLVSTAHSFSHGGSTLSGSISFATTESDRYQTTHSAAWSEIDSVSSNIVDGSTMAATSETQVPDDLTSATSSEHEAAEETYSMSGTHFVTSQAQDGSSTYTRDGETFTSVSPIAGIPDITISDGNSSTSRFDSISSSNDAKAESDSISVPSTASSVDGASSASSHSAMVETDFTTDVPSPATTEDSENAGPSATAVDKMLSSSEESSEAQETGLTMGSSSTASNVTYSDSIMSSNIDFYDATRGSNTGEMTTTDRLSPSETVGSTDGYSQTTTSTADQISSYNEDGFTFTSGVSISETTLSDDLRTMDATTTGDEIAYSSSSTASDFLPQTTVPDPDTSTGDTRETTFSTLESTEAAFFASSSIWSIPSSLVGKSASETSLYSDHDSSLSSSKGLLPSTMPDDKVLFPSGSVVSSEYVTSSFGDSQSEGTMVSTFESGTETYRTSQSVDMDRSDTSTDSVFTDISRPYATPTDLSDSTSALQTSGSMAETQDTISTTVKTSEIRSDTLSEIYTTPSPQAGMVNNTLESSTGWSQSFASSGYSSGGTWETSSMEYFTSSAPEVSSVALNPSTEKSLTEYSETRESTVPGITLTNDENGTWTTKMDTGITSDSPVVGNSTHAASLDESSFTASENISSEIMTSGPETKSLETTSGIVASYESGTPIVGLPHLTSTADNESGSTGWYPSTSSLATSTAEQIESIGNESSPFTSRIVDTASTTSTYANDTNIQQDILSTDKFSPTSSLEAQISTFDADFTTATEKSIQISSDSEDIQTSESRLETRSGVTSATNDALGAITETSRPFTNTQELNSSSSYGTDISSANPPPESSLGEFSTLSVDENLITSPTTISSATSVSSFPDLEAPSESEKEWSTMSGTYEYPTSYGESTKGTTNLVEEISTETSRTWTSTLSFDTDTTGTMDSSLKSRSDSRETSTSELVESDSTPSLGLSESTSFSENTSQATETMSGIPTDQADMSSTSDLNPSSTDVNESYMVSSDATTSSSIFSITDIADVVATQSSRADDISIGELSSSFKSSEATSADSTITASISISSESSGIDATGFLSSTSSESMYSAPSVDEGKIVVSQSSTETRESQLSSGTENISLHTFTTEIASLSGGSDGEFSTTVFEAGDSISGVTASSMLPESTFAISSDEETVRSSPSSDFAVSTPLPISGASQTAENSTSYSYVSEDGIRSSATSIEPILNEDTSENIISSTFHTSPEIVSSALVNTSISSDPESQENSRTTSSIIFHTTDGVGATTTNEESSSEVSTSLESSNGNVSTPLSTSVAAFASYGEQAKLPSITSTQMSSMEFSSAFTATSSLASSGELTSDVSRGSGVFESASTPLLEYNSSSTDLWSTKISQTSSVDSPTTEKDLLTSSDEEIISSTAASEQPPISSDTASLSGKTATTSLDSSSLAVTEDSSMPITQTSLPSEPGSSDIDSSASMTYSDGGSSSSVTESSMEMTTATSTSLSVAVSHQTSTAASIADNEKLLNGTSVTDKSASDALTSRMGASESSTSSTSQTSLTLTAESGTSSESYTESDTSIASIISPTTSPFVDQTSFWSSSEETTTASSSDLTSNTDLVTSNPDTVTTSGADSSFSPTTSVDTSEMTATSLISSNTSVDESSQFRYSSSFTQPFDDVETSSNSVVTTLSVENNSQFTSSDVTSASLGTFSNSEVLSTEATSSTRTGENKASSILSSTKSEDMLSTNSLATFEEMVSQSSQSESLSVEPTNIETSSRYSTSIAAAPMGSSSASGPDRTLYSSVRTDVTTETEEPTTSTIKSSTPSFTRSDLSSVTQVENSEDSSSSSSPSISESTLESVGTKTSKTHATSESTDTTSILSYQAGISSVGTSSVTESTVTKKQTNFDNSGSAPISTTTQPETKLTSSSSNTESSTVHHIQASTIIVASSQSGQTSASISNSTYLGSSKIVSSVSSTSQSSRTYLSGSGHVGLVLDGTSTLTSESSSLSISAQTTTVKSSGSISENRYSTTSRSQVGSSSSQISSSLSSMGTLSTYGGNAGLVSTTPTSTQSSSITRESSTGSDGRTSSQGSQTTQTASTPRTSSSSLKDTSSFSGSSSIRISASSTATQASSKSSSLYTTDAITRASSRPQTTSSSISTVQTSTSTSATTSIGSTGTSTTDISSTSSATTTDGASSADFYIYYFESSTDSATSDAAEATPSPTSSSADRVLKARADMSIMEESMWPSIATLSAFDKASMAKAKIAGYGIQTSFCMPFLNLVKPTLTQTYTQILETDLLKPYQTYTASGITITSTSTNRQLITISAVTTVYKGVRSVREISTNTQTTSSDVVINETVQESESNPNASVTKAVFATYITTSTVLKGVKSVTTTLPETLTFYSIVAPTIMSKSDVTSVASTSTIHYSTLTDLNGSLHGQDMHVSYVTVVQTSYTTVRVTTIPTSTIHTGVKSFTKSTTSTISFVIQVTSRFSQNIGGSTSQDVIYKTSYFTTTPTLTVTAVALSIKTTTYSTTALTTLRSGNGVVRRSIRTAAPIARRDYFDEIIPPELQSYGLEALTSACQDFSLPTLTPTSDRTVYMTITSNFDRLATIAGPTYYETQEIFERGYETVWSSVTLPSSTTTVTEIIQATQIHMSTSTIRVLSPLRTPVHQHTRRDTHWTKVFKFFNKRSTTAIKTTTTQVQSTITNTHYITQPSSTSTIVVVPFLTQIVPMIAFMSSQPSSWSNIPRVALTTSEGQNSTSVTPSIVLTQTSVSTVMIYDGISEYQNTPTALELKGFSQSLVLVTLPTSTTTIFRNFTHSISTTNTIYTTVPIVSEGDYSPSTTYTSTITASAVTSTVFTISYYSTQTFTSISTTTMIVPTSAPTGTLCYLSISSGGYALTDDSNRLTDNSQNVESKDIFIFSSNSLYSLTRKAWLINPSGGGIFRTGDTSYIVASGTSPSSASTRWRLNNTELTFHSSGIFGGVASIMPICLGGRNDSVSDIGYYLRLSDNLPNRYTDACSIVDLSLQNLPWEQL